MDVGKPQRRHVVEPVEDPVPRELPSRPDERPDVPAQPEPEKVPAP